MPAQVSTNEGLVWLFNQLCIGGSPTTPSYAVGLFTGDLPDASVTLGTISEVIGDGYVRQPVTFASPVTARITALSTTLTETSASGSWTVTLASTTGIEVGMVITLDVSVTRIITGVLNGGVVVLNRPLDRVVESGMYATVGDGANGIKSVGSPVRFYAQGLWQTLGGYFVADTNGSHLLFASTFADSSTPTLTATDALGITPTWLLSN